MPTVRIRRSDGAYCFHCNARVENSAGSCPECGRDFAPDRDGQGPGVRSGPVRPPGRLGERIRRAHGGGRRSYKTAVIVLAALALMSGLLFRRRTEPPLFFRPELPEVAARVFDVREHPAGRVERRSLFARVRSGLPEDSLRAALDWLMYRTIDERNRVEGGNLRVVWAYLYDEESVPATGWRAMAIWQVPGLPEVFRPSGMGAAGFRAGDVQYSFLNLLHKSPGGDDDR